MPGLKAEDISLYIEKGTQTSLRIISEIISSAQWHTQAEANLNVLEDVYSRYKIQFMKTVFNNGLFGAGIGVAVALAPAVADYFFGDGEREVNGKAVAQLAVAGVGLKLTLVFQKMELYGRIADVGRCVKCAREKVEKLKEQQCLGYNFSLYLKTGKESCLQKAKELSGLALSARLEETIAECEREMQRVRLREIGSPPAIGLGVGSLAGNVASAALGWNKAYTWAGMSLFGAALGGAYEKYRQAYVERIEKARGFCKYLHELLGEARRRELMPEHKEDCLSETSLPRRRGRSMQ